MLVIPFMSCSARLPIYVLFTGTFFPNHAATMMILLYITGILVAAISAKLLRIVKFGEDETPFVMELPPYRMPTALAVLKHMWEKCVQYLRKIGTVILGASVIIWVLSYFPRPMIEETIETGETILVEAPAGEVNCENSYLGKFGKIIEPVMRPLGFDWKASVAVVASLPAKEIAVSTLGVLYGNIDEDSLGEALIKSGSYSPAVALAMMIFMLLCFPCLATIAAIYGESGKKRWAAFTIIYNTLVAWILAFIAFKVGNVFL